MTVFPPYRRARAARVSAIVVSLSMAAALPIGARAGSAPVNDAFASARVINAGALPYSDTVAASGASTEPNEPATGCDATPFGSMWWRFTPSTNGTYRADTIGSGFNTLLDVYRGTTLTGLTAVDCNDDIDSNNPGLLVSRVAFKGVAGQTYYLRVSPAGSFGPSATLHLGKVTPPANDSFAKATTISSLPFDTNAANANATSQPTEPRPGLCDQQRATRWYRYTPAVDQVIWANTLVATDFDTLLGVYTGSNIASAALVACNDDQWASGGMTDSSGVSFRALAGVTYRFQVGGYDGESGDVGELPFHVRAVDPASNDNFANATTFSGVPYTAAFNLRRSTVQPSEGCLFDGVANTLWWKFTAPVTAFLHAETSLPVEVRIGAWRVDGPGLSDLQSLACGSGVTFSATAGTTYAIQVSGPRAVAPSGTWTIDYE